MDVAPDRSKYLRLLPQAAIDSVWLRLPYSGPHYPLEVKSKTASDAAVIEKTSASAVFFCQSGLDLSGFIGLSACGIQVASNRQPGGCQAFPVTRRANLLASRCWRKTARHGPRAVSVGQTPAHRARFSSAGSASNCNADAGQPVCFSAVPAPASASSMTCSSPSRLNSFTAGRYGLKKFGANAFSQRLLACCFFSVPDRTRHNSRGSQRRSPVCWRCFARGPRRAFVAPHCWS